MLLVQSLLSLRPHPISTEWQVLRNPVSEELDESSTHTATELRRRGFEPYNQQVKGCGRPGRRERCWHAGWRLRELAE